MDRLAEDSLDLLNGGHFQITDPGPLHAPIQCFTVRRDDKLTLTLETEADAGATSTAKTPRPGTVRFATDVVKLVNIAGVEAELSGVIGYHLSNRDGGHSRSPLKELAQVHQLRVTPGDAGAAAFTIDWLENLPRSPFVWPDLFRTETETKTTRSIAPDNEGITITASRGRTSTGHSAAKLTVDGLTFYVCAIHPDDSPGSIKPGCVIYTGTPDELFRKKIRTALSLALGLYLVDLGHTIYDHDWRIVAGTARSAYSLGKRAFDLGPQPLAPLRARTSQLVHQLHRSELTRMVVALVSAFDELDLANLSWAYWHACAATVHIAPAHFGAAIEALQRAYVKAHPEGIMTTIVPREQWNPLADTLTTVVQKSGLSQDAAGTFKRKLQNLNRLDQRPLLKAVLAAIGLRLSADEDSAWARRNDAAHGVPIPEGEELGAIRDMKLLRGLFHRMLLKITNAADFYFDYASPDHLERRLEQPPDSTGASLA